MFNAIIEQAGLIKLDLSGRQYTRGNNLQNPTFEKLGRVLSCPDWGENYPMTEVIALVREKSDHTPFFLDYVVVPKIDPIFRFENSWFMRDGIQKIVVDT